MTKKKSDLGVRAASAVVIIAVAGMALWLGGWFWALLVSAIAIGVFYEWSKLSFGLAEATVARIAWLIGGALYIIPASYLLGSVRFLEEQRGYDAGIFYVVLILATVIAVDVGAYFFGRSIGGPKIAPSISPSKTWAGLFGGAIGATIAICAVYGFYGYDWLTVLEVAWIAGPLVAIVAQAGDFFESWMKRRAGVKDSSHLIPGHGGLFDRVDGLLAVLFVLGVAYLLLSGMHTA